MFATPAEAKRIRNGTSGYRYLAMTAKAMSASTYAAGRRYSSASSARRGHVAQMPNKARGARTPKCQTRPATRSRTDQSA